MTPLLSLPSRPTPASRGITASPSTPPSASMLNPVQRLTREAHLATIAVHTGTDPVCDCDISALNAVLWYFDTQVELALLQHPAPLNASPAETLRHLKALARNSPLPLPTLE
jgi:hypothetical protein